VTNRARRALGKSITRTAGPEHPLWDPNPQVDPSAPYPEAEVDWPGLPQGLVFDPNAPTPPGKKGRPKQKVPGALVQERPDGTRAPVDPTEHHLDPLRPFEPNLAGPIGKSKKEKAILRSDVWRERFRERLSPEELGQVDSVVNEVTSEQKARSRYKALDNVVQDRNLDEKPRDGLKKNDLKLMEEWDQLKHRFGPLPRSEGGRPPAPTDLHVGALPTQLHEDFVNPEDHTIGVNNILGILKAARPDEIEYWKRWYDIAQADVMKLAKQHRKPPGVVAGIVAALSPNAAWEQNIYAAQRVLEGHGKKQLDSEDRATAAGATDIYKRVYPELDHKPDKLGVFTYSDNIRKAQNILDAYERSGKWEDDLGKRVQLEWNPKNQRDVARAERAFHNYTHNRGFSSWVTKSANAWVPFAQVNSFNPQSGRMVFIPPLGDPDSGAKKVNAFYGNVLEPKKNANNPVVDGHAANIYYGNSNRKLDEVGLTDVEYTAIAKAYKDAAAQSGPILKAKGLEGELTPQQIQAVTWSVWRKAIKNKPPKTAGYDEPIIPGKKHYIAPVQPQTRADIIKAILGAEELLRSGHPDLKRPGRKEAIFARIRELKDALLKAQASVVGGVDHQLGDDHVVPVRVGQNSILDPLARRAGDVLGVDTVAIHAGAQLGHRQPRGRGTEKNDHDAVEEGGTGALHHVQSSHVAPAVSNKKLTSRSLGVVAQFEPQLTHHRVRPAPGPVDGDIVVHPVTTGQATMWQVGRALNGKKVALGVEYEDRRRAQDHARLLAARAGVSTWLEVVPGRPERLK